MSCLHQNKEIRKMELPNNKYHIAYQCLTCGMKIGNWMSHKGIDVDSLPVWDANINHNYNQIQQEQRRNKYEVESIEREKEKHREYEKYIYSPQWKDRRIRVLERCGDLCECCLLRKAVQVHHTTYDNFKNEMLWELRGVCIKCHEWIHNRRFS